MCLHRFPPDMGSSPFKRAQVQAQALNKGLKSGLKSFTLISFNLISLKRARSSSIKGLTPSPDLSPCIKGGLKSSQK